MGADNARQILRALGKHPRQRVKLAVTRVDESLHGKQATESHNARLTHRSGKTSYESKNSRKHELKEMAASGEGLSNDDIFSFLGSAHDASICNLQTGVAC